MVGRVDLRLVTQQDRRRHLSGVGKYLKDGLGRRVVKEEENPYSVVSRWVTKKGPCVCQTSSSCGRTEPSLITKSSIE